jgi:hypothetical protein
VDVCWSEASLGKRGVREDGEARPLTLEGLAIDTSALQQLQVPKRFLLKHETGTRVRETGSRNQRGSS